MGDRVLIFGSNGQVGTSLQKYAPSDYEIVAHDRSKFDLIDSPAVERFIRAVDPKCVINAAAYTDVDGAEDVLNKHRCWHANVQFPAQLAKLSSSLGFHLVHYSTDYVFDGFTDLTGKYFEQSDKNPVNFYGSSKSDGEDEVMLYTNSYTIYRVQAVYSAGNKNFHAAILRAAATKDKLEVVDDQFTIPTSSDWIAKKTWERLKLDSGLNHLVPRANYGDSFYEFAKCIKLAYNLSTEIVPSKLANLNKPAKRPRNTQMTSTNILQSESWQEVYAQFLIENNLP
jgi:dTDP-4-dehydrorhamnose reductase